MRYLFDTNICIHLIQCHPKHLLARCEKLEYGEAVISVITLSELRHGVERHPATRRAAGLALDRLLHFFPVLPFDTEAAESYGVLAAAVRDRRRDALDRLIAAHAVSLGLVLVTNNEADFKEYPGLALENWVRSS